jgi:hypothetical protein
MSSTYSPDLRIELVANGEQSGVWGNTTNNNLGTLIEQAISAAANVAITNTDQALVALYGVTDEARCAVINLASTTTGATFNVYVPPVPKLYVFINSTGQAAKLYVSSVLGNTTPAIGAGTFYALAAGATAYVRATGTIIEDAINSLSTLAVSGTATGTTPTAGDNTTKFATTAFVSSAIAAIPGAATYQTLAAAVVATTGNITLSGTQTIDGIGVIAGERVLVKEQTTAANNGVYVVAASTWSRSTDADTNTKIAAAQVPILKGTANGGKTFITGFRATDTLDFSAMSWYPILNGPNSITVTELANDAVETAKIADSNVTVGKLADSAVETAKIADANITAAKLNGAQSGAAPIYGVRAWVSFNGAAVGTAINAAGNVASVVRTATGRYTITFTEPMQDEFYAVSAIGYNTNPDGEAYAHVIAQTATFVQLSFGNSNDTRVEAGLYASVMFVR